MDNKQPNRGQQALILSCQILGNIGEGQIGVIDVPGHGTLLFVPAQANPAGLVDAAAVICRERGMAGRD